MHFIIKVCKPTQIFEFSDHTKLHGYVGKTKLKK